ncbi:MAG: cob(I)yrinic acid a,c-diamide adenosyltransferase, partial [Eubacterium sp.]
ISDSAFNYIKNSTADMVILDEFLDIVGRFISAENAAYLIENTDGEVIITGHKKIEELFDMADYITYFEKIRHPFDVGTSARTGIEY